MSRNKRGQQRADSRPQAVQKIDSYQQHMQPYARRARRRQIDSRPNYRGRLSLQELAEWYRTNRLVRRIVDLPANAAANDIPQFAGPNKEFWSDLFVKLDVMPSQRSGLRWAGLFGLGGVLIDVNDRLPLDQPINPRRASAIVSLTPLDRRVLTPEDLTAGPKSEYFRVMTGGLMLARVHRSRLLIYDGEDTDAMTRLSNGGCGESRVEQGRDGLARLFGGHESLGFALQTFSTFLYRVKDLDNMVASDGDKVARKLDAMDEFRHLTRMLTVDIQDEISYQTMNLTGFPDCLNVLKEMVAIEMGIPQMILFGTSPTGSSLAAGGASEIAQWEGQIGQLRTDRLDRPTQQFMELASVIYRKPVPGYKYCPALPPDREKELKNRQLQAQIDGVYMGLGVYGVQTVQQRFEGDYSFETQIHPDELGPKEEPPTMPDFGPDPGQMDPNEADPAEQEPGSEDPAKPLPQNTGK